MMSSTYFRCLTFSSLAEVASSLQAHVSILVRYVYQVALSATLSSSVTSITVLVKSFLELGVCFSVLVRASVIFGRGL